MLRRPRVVGMVMVGGERYRSARCNATCNMQAKQCNTSSARPPAAASNVGLGTNLVPVLYDHSNILRVTERIPLSAMIKNRSDRNS